MPRLKLRQDIVRTVPYRALREKGQCVYWDEALESFGLRVHPSGRRVYVCAYGIRQRKRLATLGRADALSLYQAPKEGDDVSRQGGEPRGPAEQHRRASATEDDR